MVFKLWFKASLKIEMSSRRRGDNAYRTPDTQSCGRRCQQGRGGQEAQDGHVLKDPSWVRGKRSGQRDGRGTDTKRKPVTPASCPKILRQGAARSASGLRRAAGPNATAETPAGPASLTKHGHALGAKPARLSCLLVAITLLSSHFPHAALGKLGTGTRLKQIAFSPPRGSKKCPWGHV